MKKEVELKFFVDDLGVLRKKLKKLGAKFEWAGSERDFYFDTAGKKLKKRRSMLRLRITPDFSYLTYKEGVTHGKFKIADEYEVSSIKNPQELKNILERLGFAVWVSYRKPRREFWKLQGYHITLDSFPFGKFVEVEGTGKFIRNTAAKLGLNFAKSSTKSYIQLLEEYRKKKPG